MNDTRKHEHAEARMVELLERLSAAERSGPDAGFEARVAAGSLAEAEAPIAFPAVSKRAWWAGAPVRVAAAVALVAGAWFVVNRAMPGGGATTPKSGTGALASSGHVKSDALSDEEWFETYTLVTAALDGGAGDAIDELVSDTAELGTRVKGASSVDSFLGDTL